MFGIFKRRLDQAFDKVNENREIVDEEEFKTTMQQEMEKGDFLAMILGAYRFFLPLFIGIILIIIAIYLFWK